MIKNCFILFFLACISPIFSQKNCKSDFKKINKIEKLIEKNENKAFEDLLKLENSCSEYDFKIKIGELYNRYGKYEKLVNFYYQNWSIYYPEEVILQFLNSCIYTNNYQLGLDIIKSYPKGFSFTQKINDLIQNISFGTNQLKNPDLINVQRLPFSSDKDEYFPSVTSDTSSLIYTRRDAQDENFYLVSLENGHWSNPKILNFPSNTIYNEGAYSLSSDSKEIFFASCNRVDGYGNCDLYYAEIINDSVWSEPINLGPSINTKAWESQPSISLDNKFLFFSSNRDGGFGRRDIWCSIRLDKYNWSEPFNLGPNINTVKDEITPFIFYDSNKMYFASSGHIGMGGYDLFVSEFDNGFFEKATNLGFPINSNKDESSLIITKNNQKAFLASNRGENNDLDLYTFYLTENMKSNKFIELGGVILDSISLKPINNCKIIFYNQESFYFTTSSNSEGNFLITLPEKENVNINIISKNHLFFSENIEVGNKSNLDLKFILKRIKKGEKLILSNVLFDTDQYSLDNDFLEEIKQLAYYLNNNTEIKIEIAGHTDNVGSEDYNYILSEKRAKAVYEKLIEYGVNKNQLSYIGYGFSNPIYSNENEEKRSLNRRTEIIYY
mgnify:CR=1 FL=1